jgi:hypothetical protein
MFKEVTQTSFKQEILAVGMLRKLERHNILKVSLPWISPKAMDNILDQ